MKDIYFLKPIAIKGKVRLGVNRDGGYVVYEKILNKTQILISYGVGWEISFEEHFNRVTGKRVVMFDPTNFGKYLLDFPYLFRLAKRIEIVRMIRYLLFVARCWRKIKQLRMRDINFVNEGIATCKAQKYDTIVTHFKKLAVAENEVLLKIDIEGNEYAILQTDAFYEILENVNQIIIEFHDLKKRLRDLDQIVRRLSSEYYIIHVHGNNYSETFCLYGAHHDDIIFPDAIELTFLRKSMLDVSDKLDCDVEYPVTGLDFPNNPSEKDYQILFSTASPLMNSFGNHVREIGEYVGLV